MKLYILRAKEASGPWHPWYDKAFGFVIRAKTEEAARKLADQNAGDENRDYDDSAPHPWLLETYSTCDELAKPGPEELILRDFAAA